MLVNIGKAIELEIDHTALPSNALEHVIAIGLRNILMDSHAGVTAEKVGPGGDVQAESKATALKKLDALMRGEVRVSGSREGDPVRAEAIRSASAVIVAALKKAGQIKKVADIDSKLLREKAVELIGKKPEFLEKAREVVAARKDATVNLADIGL